MRPAQPLPDGELNVGAEEPSGSFRGAVSPVAAGSARAHGKQQNHS
jgi:hypothetical protein